MSPKVDWGQATEVEFEPLPNGMYEARLTGFEESDGAGPSGYPYFNLEWTVDDGEFQGRKVWNTLSLSPKALFMGKRVLLALGADEGDVSPGSDRDIEDMLDELTGNPVRLVLKQRRWTDPDTDETKIQNDIKRVLPPSIGI